MVVSQNRGTPIQTPKYYNPYYKEPPKRGTPNFEKPAYIGVQRVKFKGIKAQALGSSHKGSQAAVQGVLRVFQKLRSFFKAWELQGFKFQVEVAGLIEMRVYA